MDDVFTPMRFDGETLELIDQRQLPSEETWIRCRTAAETADAIRQMVVRGAPAIGATAAFGFVLAARASAGESPGELRRALAEAAETLEGARPTAVNLAWAVERMSGVANRALDEHLDNAEVLRRLGNEAQAIFEEDMEANRAMGRHGAMLVPDGARVLTHCNTGALATTAYGTALGVIRAAAAEGKSVRVFADETRPYLQGARLTAWELQRDGIPVTVITDNAAGHLMARGEIDLVIVGSDRIAINGDVANKIGTYTVAVLARRHGIPFYVAAPTSTVDADCPEGAAIPIEERDSAEVLELLGRRTAPDGVDARHPAFDVTPAELVTAIVTEQGIHRAPYREALLRALGREDEIGEEVAEGIEEASDAEVPAGGEGEANADEMVAADPSSGAGEEASSAVEPDQEDRFDG
jgi:methylthioribose-1-phosphate isomerase